MARLFRLTITKKLLLGYLSYAVLTVLIAVVTLVSLQRVNEINHRIIGRDVPLIEIADKMIDTLLAQELYGRRSLILKSPEMEVLFWRRSKEFKRLLQQMRDLPDTSDFDIDRLEVLHEEHNYFFKNRLEGKATLSARDNDLEIKEKQEEIIRLAKMISRDAKADQIEKSHQTLATGRFAFWLTAGLSIGGLLLGVIIILMITRNISRSITQLKRSTQEISEGKFDRLPDVRNQDELGDLYQSFQTMTERLKRLEEMHLDANPLTHLPGSGAIENALKQRLKDEVDLAFCQFDLSHFKAFNDRYGYARGNEVIQATANAITEAAAAQGDKETFVGHIGGDDFVMITSLENYEKICLATIDSFDQRIRNFYDQDDRERGYIQGETRQGEKVTFPIMTLAIAVVTNQGWRLQNPLQVAEIAAELKNYAKSFSRSLFVVDRRREDSPDPADGRAC